MEPTVPFVPFVPAEHSLQDSAWPRRGRIATAVATAGVSLLLLHAHWQAAPAAQGGGRVSEGSAPPVFGPFLEKSPQSLAASRASRHAACSEAGPSPCIRETALGVKGDASRDGFARADENLVFFDTFSEDKLDYTVWVPERTMGGDGNNCFEYYTASEGNLYINHTDRSLRLKPALFETLGTLETAAGLYSATDVLTGNCTPYPACATFSVPNCTSGPCEVVGSSTDALSPVTSAKVNTRDSFSFTYGRMEVEMRAPAGDWLWPAVWMMPYDFHYGMWPDSGEIDLLEAHGNYKFSRHGKIDGRERFATTLHFMGNAWWAAQGEAVRERGDWTTKPFTLGFYWSENDMYSYIRDPPDNATEQILFNVTNLARPLGNSSFFDAPYGAQYNMPPGDKAWMREIMTPMQNDPEKQPYRGQASNAPFDRPFYLVLNVAVGGAQAGCPEPDYWGTEAIWCRCHPNCEASPRTEFLKARQEWEPSWHEAEASDTLSMAIYSVKIWQ